jgi:uncharacterized protein
MNRLVVFVKAPRPGEVKTRLAARLGAVEACAAYRRMAGFLLDRLAPLRAVELRYAPENAAEEISAWRRDGWSLAFQGEGDLGARLGAAFREHFRDGAGQVVVIGSDCPDVTVRDIECAWAGLAENDVVIGPARDGGYWLIGLNRPQPHLFEDMPWSTETVLRETLARASSTGIRVHLLRELSDVDVESDWVEFRQRNDGAGE